MIITRTPLRISLGGGGTDIPAYYQRNGGMVISAAITRYIYVALNRTFTNDYFLKYAESERVTEVTNIRHPIIREALLAFPTGPGIELVSVADIPSGTGLGSSGTFTVGLLRAFHAARHEATMASDLAEQACDIEINKLGRAVGKQDQYIAAFGGFTCFTITQDGTVNVAPLLVTGSTLRQLEEHLVLYFTGYSRESISILDRESQALRSDDREMVDNMDAIAALADDVKRSLEAGDCEAFADLMHEHWNRKRARLGGGETNDVINHWYDHARKNGARGGKLVGAGGGGFLLLYAEDRNQLRAAMAESGMAEVAVGFDHDGSTVMVRD